VNAEDRPTVLDDVTEEGPHGTVVRTTNGDEKTKRTLGVIVVFALTGIALAVLGLLAFTVFRGNPETLDVISATVQPGTVVVAAISAIAGIAAGAGLRDH